MEIKKNNNEVISSHLRAGEELIGYVAVSKNLTMCEQILRGLVAASFSVFIIMTMHSAWWLFFAVLLLGIFQSILGMSYPKPYTLGVTNLGIHRASASSLIPWLGKSASYVFYSYEDIANIYFAEGYLTSTLEVKFKDDKIATYSVGKFPCITEKTKEYLLSKVR